MSRTIRLSKGKSWGIDLKGNPCQHNHRNPLGKFSKLPLICIYLSCKSFSLCILANASTSKGI
ncbi:hypothetical protein LOK49_LG03G03332 [Camellia lanceoleosa]|uniref:Uncharacterized protein n=1 Tax=Camellia lanceoleosa TaxID=1840588 RepID=A0ACC0I6G1_9ERIC|nr:hypothetical protein LOK49_LG03G03332 [Camellia lanceoleosa]